MAKTISKKTTTKTSKSSKTATNDILKVDKAKATTTAKNTKSSTKKASVQKQETAPVATKKANSTKATSTKKVATKVAVKATNNKTNKSQVSTSDQRLAIQSKPIKKVLVSQPKPTSDKSPYYDLAHKYNLELTFHQFIKVEGFTVREFKKQSIEFSDYTGIVMLSRNAVDHFFRMCNEIKYKVPQELRYFCATESVALYLQKFIVYRKRKVYFSADGSPDGLVDVMMKFASSRFIMPVSEHTKNEISPRIKAKNIDLTETVLYRTVGNELSKLRASDYDLVLFFSPFGIEAAMQDMKELQEQHIRIGTFGATTTQAAEDQGLHLIIKAPTPTAPSMITALDHYLRNK